MKKKVILLSSLGAVSLFIVIFSIVMLATISDDNLLYTNVEFGSFCAKGYRWAILALVTAVSVWLVLGIKVIVPSIKRNIEKRKNALVLPASEIPQQSVYQPADVNPTAIVQPILTVTQAVETVKYKPKFCPFCGGKLESDSEFCSKCGKKIPEPIF